MILTWSPLAVERVAEIATWIAADRPTAAEKLAVGIFDAVERLNEFPLSRRQVPEFERPELLLTGVLRPLKGSWAGGLTSGGSCRR